MKSDKELSDQILTGLKLAYKKMLDFKRKNNSEIVVLRDNKIVRLKP